jgi:hypothetical protein
MFVCFVLMFKQIGLVVMFMDLIFGDKCLLSGLVP